LAAKGTLLRKLAGLLLRKLAMESCTPVYMPVHFICLAQFSTAATGPLRKQAGGHQVKHGHDFMLILV
jgi:hypothetical protein